ncbi:MAG TPA: hypothetical protein VMF89_24020 [Polyangiales bacterium]|nr:hypothetical protein [Polyangiales bacterium]
MAKAKVLMIDLLEDEPVSETVIARGQGVHVNADDLWVDERARCRLLEAFGELTLADLDNSAADCGSFRA